MATPPPDIAAKLAILRQQAAERVKQDAEYKQQADRQYTPVLQPNPNWMPKKAGGGSMRQDAMQLALLNKQHLAYGGPARNWAPGQEEKIRKELLPLKKKAGRYTHINDQGMAVGEGYGRPMTPEELERFKLSPHDEAINQWLDTVAHNYIKKQMATEKDPVRHQAESDVFHMAMPEEPGYWQRKGETRRKISGGEQMAKSDKAKSWENRTDAMLEAEEAQAHQDMMHLAPGMYTEKDEWVKKLDPKTKLWNLTEHFDTSDLGLDHIRDVLHEDLVSGRIRPEQLSKISMAQAVQRAHQYDQEMEKKRQETAIKQTEGMPTVHDYPEEGMKWIELAPKEVKSKADLGDLGLQAYFDYTKSGGDEQYALKAGQKADAQKYLAEALKYEGDTMGHCVGSYCPDVLEGRSRIYSLRDKKGEPHVTIETQPPEDLPVEEFTRRLTDEQKQQMAQRKNNAPTDPFSQMMSVRQTPEYQQMNEEWRKVAPHRIKQIKGKGNAKPHKKYIPHVQHFVKSGKWSDVQDLMNADLYHVHPESDVAKNLMQAGEEVPTYVSNEELTNLGKKFNKAQGGIIRKAEGGNVQLSVEQMRQQLMAAGKPLQDISQIGAQEAPSMPVKSFVIPSNGAQGPMPMGGVDMSPQQPGQQMLPANAMAPNPLMPQQPQQPSGPAPQGGGNILQMTPQGQKMAALAGSPQGNLPQPPQMATGGPVPGPQPVNNHPFQGSAQKPIPFMAKVGGSDNMPMDNQSMDNGATTFNIDNIQELAKGGQPKKSLHYAPAPALSKAEIEAMAERMARQISGLDNPNAKTLQQLAREQNLPVEIKGSKKMDVPVINYEDLKGSYSVGVPGDTSRGGVKPTRRSAMSPVKAGEYLHSIGGEKLDSPVPLYGGKDYGAFGHPEGWASDLGASAGMFNVVKKLAEENPEREVYGHYHKMSPEALNHALHMLDSVLSYHKPHASPAERIAMLNDLMRNKTTTTSKHDVPYPEFPGFEKPEDIMLQAAMNSGMRKKVIGLLGKEKYFPGGKQKLDDIIYAISHPELRNIETGAGGSSIIKFDPSRELRESVSPHPTYGHDIPSRLVGKTRYITPAEIIAPRSMANAAREIKAMGKKVVPFNQAKMNIIREPIDEQFINQMGQYEHAMKKRLGYKKGGKVKLSDNMDTINLELSKSRKKAK